MRNTSPTVHPARRQRLTRLVSGVVVLAVVALGGCGDDDTTADTTVPPTVEVPAEGDQRELTARLTEIDTASASVELDEVDVLTGEEARQAAIEAGEIGADEDLPNDVWIRDDSDATERVPVDPEAVVWIYDCTGACERVQVDRDAFLRNEIQPFGGDGAVWEITITEAMVTSLLEVYLP